MISVRSLSFKYTGSAAPALRDISFDLPRGAFLGVAGGSASGKSTLMKSLAGIIPHYADGDFYGAVEIFGIDTADCGPLDTARRAAYVGEDVESQMTCETVEEEILFGLENFGVPRPEMEKRLNTALERFSITHLRERQLSSLSGGQRQKVLIAAMTALEPELLILDCPSAELDPRATEQLYALLRSLNAMGMTIVTAEQKTGMLFASCSHLAVIENGALAAFGTVREAAASAFSCGHRGVCLPQSTELGMLLAGMGFETGPMPLCTDDAEDLIRGLCCDRV